jgi:excisionase family DNA binding protein
MSLATAARYLSIDEHSFRSVARAHDLRTVDLGLDLERRRRSDLDRLIAKLPNREGLLPLRLQRNELAPSGGLTDADVDRIAAKLRGRTEPARDGACDLREAAATLSISRTTLYRLVNEGRLKTIRIAGRVLVRRSDLEQLLNA